MSRDKDVIAAQRMREIQRLESGRNKATSKFIEGLSETDKELYRNARREIREDVIRKDRENGFTVKEDTE